MPDLQLLGGSLDGLSLHYVTEGRGPATLLVHGLGGFVRAMGLERVRLVGHSLGGAVVASYALAYPKRVERLALVGAAVPGFPLRPSLPYRLMALPGLGELILRLATPRLCAAALGRCVVEADPADLRFIVEHEYRGRATREGRA